MDLDVYRLMSHRSPVDIEALNAQSEREQCQYQDHAPYAVQPRRSYLQTRLGDTAAHRFIIGNLLTSTHRLLSCVTDT